MSRKQRDSHLPKSVGPRLVVDASVKLPAPLDRRIASLSLRTKSNDPTDGFDLTLSASFGSERIKIRTQRFEVDVLFSIKSATIELTFHNCDPQLRDTEDTRRAEAWVRTETNQSAHRDLAGAQIELNGSIAQKINSLKGAAMWRRNSENTQQAKLEAKRTQQDWYLLGNDAVKIGRTGLILDGPVVADLTAWRAIPRTAESSAAVYARVNVREDWVTFSDPVFDNISAEWKSRLGYLLRQKEERKQYFLALLRHLVQRKLQRSAENRDATLAISCVVVRPDMPNSLALTAHPDSGVVEVPLEPIEQFFEAEEGYEAAALIALGVPSSVILPVSNGERKSRNRDGIFVPQGSPPRAIEALNSIKANPGQSRTRCEEKYGRNTIRELFSLGLLNINATGVFLGSDTVANPETILRRAVSLEPSIKAARSTLIINPGATTSEIADAVAAQAGVAWDNEATKKRHGNTVRRWAVWLEPHLIDPQSGSDAARLIASALSEAPGKGAPPLINDEIAQRISEMLSEGLSNAAIGRKLGTSPTFVISVKKRLGVYSPRRYVRLENISDRVVEMTKNRLSNEKIASELGLSKKTVGVLKKRLGLTRSWQRRQSKP